MKISNVAPFIVLVFGLNLQGQPQAGVPEGCQNSTVDAFGLESAIGARAFLGALQAAVKAGDRTRVASMVNYPMRLFMGSKRQLISAPSEFVSKYDSILTDHVKKTIANQPARCLFGNWDGSMIGSGEVWFQRQSDGIDKIISIQTRPPGR